MKQMINRIFLLLSIVIVMSSCHRKPLYDTCLCEDTLEIPIDIDWETSGVTPQNVTILFYDTTTEELAYEHTYEHNSQPIQSYVSLGRGSYTAVVFNELRDQIDYVKCFGHESFSTLNFVSDTAEPLRAKAATRNYVKQPGELAVAIVKGIEVTDEMIVEAAKEKDHNHQAQYAVSPATKVTVESLMKVVPFKKSNTVTIRAHIKNIYYARMPALVDLLNLADGYNVADDTNSSNPSTVQFTMNNRTYDKDAFYDGTISATITTFGTLNDRASTAGHDSSTPIILDLLFKQVDEKQSEFSMDMDVTKKLTHTLQSDGSYLINIDVAFDEELPKVEPEGSDGDSGFGADVEDWTDVNVSLDQ